MDKERMIEVIMKVLPMKDGLYQLRLDAEKATYKLLAELKIAGVVMVPVEPTEAQRAAGDGAIDQYESRHLILAEDREAMAVAAYGAMLAAKDAR